MLILDKVLHLEDHSEIRRLVRSYFKNEWKRIDEATSLREGLQLIEATRNNYQLIILDLGMNGTAATMTVEKCVNKIATVHACSVAPIVLYTGVSEDIIAEIRKRSSELGVYGVIRKRGTFSPDRVRSEVENAVRTWREERFARTIGSLSQELDSIAEHRRKVISEMGH